MAVAAAGDSHTLAPPATAACPAVESSFKGSGLEAGSQSRVWVSSATSWCPQAGGMSHSQARGLRFGPPTVPENLLWLQGTKKFYSVGVSSRQQGR